jgi:hypothetical protein
VMLNKKWYFQLMIYLSKQIIDWCSIIEHSAILVKLKEWNDGKCDPK